MPRLEVVHDYAQLAPVVGLPARFAHSEVIHLGEGLVAQHQIVAVGDQHVLWKDPLLPEALGGMVFRRMHDEGQQFTRVEDRRLDVELGVRLPYDAALHPVILGISRPARCRLESMKEVEYLKWWLPPPPGRAKPTSALG